MIPFPVDFRDFMGCFKLEQTSFDLTEGVLKQAQRENGAIITGAGPTRVWFGSVSLHAMRYDDAAALHARLHALRGHGASFWIGDMRRKQAAGTAKLSSVSSSGAVALKDMPEGRTLVAGEYLSFTYGQRRALHQVVLPGARGQVTQTGMAVVPPIATGWAVDAVVELGTPKCLAKMDPGTARPGLSGPVATEGLSFNWRQVL